MIVLCYASKAELKAQIGQPLKFIETSCAGPEYVRDGELLGANRPHVSGIGREFFATVTMKDGLIAKVK